MSNSYRPDPHDAARVRDWEARFSDGVRLVHEFATTTQPVPVAKETEKVFEIADALLGRIAEEVEHGDASLLSDLSDALWNVVSAVRTLQDL